jgi:hypothetical protein
MPTARSRRKPLHKRKWVWALALLLVAWGVCVGPWPAYSGGYEGTGYAEATFERLDGLDLRAAAGPLRAGAAKVDVTPAVGAPLAGYGGRKPKASAGVRDRVFARAVTFSSGDATVTVVGGDLLLVMPQLREAVLAQLDRPPDELYFTASHTHSGPGGYSSRWVDELVLGECDPAVADRLADGLAEAVRQSRNDLRPATVQFARAAADGEAAGRYVRNRLDKSPGYAAAAALVARDAEGRTIGGVVVFSAHATCLGDENRQVSGDYPGRVARRLEAETGGVVLFAAGAVGSMGPAARSPRGPERLSETADDALAMLRPLVLGGEAGAGIRIQRHPPAKAMTVCSRRLAVDLPPQQYRISARWRLSPVAAGYLHGRRTFLHVLRIGPAVLLGMPCDYSGELARRLDDAETALTPVVTSFNGDYIGYLLPRERYGEDHYESRDMNLFGPACGEYFHALSLRGLERAAEYGGE